MGLPGWKLDQLEEIILNVITTEHHKIRKKVEFVNKIRNPDVIVRRVSDIRGTSADFVILF
jgi:hypothetical protein